MGIPETEVFITYTDDGGEKREKKITRAKRSGTAVGPKGIFYFAIEFEAKRLDSYVGYIRLNTLQAQPTTQISKAIESMGNISGIIIDLRGNSGGEIEGMLDLFLTEKTFLHFRRTRDGETKIFSDPPNDVYQGPLVVLIDELSGSASELFAACLQAVKRAVVVGERSPGSVIESDTMIFPDGAVFMYPVAQISTPDGTVLEGYGVIPDIEAGLKRELLLKGIDSQLDSALRHIKKEMWRNTYNVKTKSTDNLSFRKEGSYGKWNCINAKVGSIRITFHSAHLSLEYAEKHNEAFGKYNAEKRKFEEKLKDNKVELAKQYKI